MKGAWRSIRGRFAIIAGAAVAGLAVAAAYGTWRVAETAREGRAVVAGHERVRTLLDDLERAVRGAELALYRHVTFLEPADRMATELALAKAATARDALAAEPVVRADPGLRKEIREVGRALVELAAGMREVLGRLERAETRYPGMPVLLDELFPTNQAFLDALRTALQEAREVEAETPGPRIHEVVHLLEELRYAWSQLVSQVRLFIANRSGVFGDPERAMANNLHDRALYVEQVQRLLGRLEALARDGGLPFAVEAVVEELRALARRYEAIFAKAVGIYRSEGWRAEIPILRERVMPVQARLWKAMARSEGRLARLARAQADASQRAAAVLSSILWLFALGVGGLVIAAYVAFGRLVHRPLAVVAQAMEREGAGGEALPLPPVQVEEVAQLVRAFDGMRSQVRQRERRLQAILDHAAEGVVTMDAAGRIEGFNRAAERLFGYRAEEVIGADVMILVPPEDRPRYRRWLRRLASGRETGTRRPVMGRGLRRDGTHFSLEVNLSTLDFEGRRLIIALVSDVSEREAMVDHLRELAERDALTGIYNRHYLMQELERAVERARRGQGSPCGLLYIDLDNFKYVNDTLGHLVGDRVLQEVTGLLRRRVRRGDLLARLGGDEFAVLLYDVDEDAALAAAEGYRRQLAGYTVAHEGRVIDVGCSIGVAVLTPDIASKEDLLARADLAVHLAKRAGRNRVHLFRPEDRGDLEAMSADIGWVRRIRQAIAEDRFVLTCQPIVRCADRSVHGYEVLVRMTDERGETVQPGGFLPSAERFGLMAEIDRWVVEKALALLAEQHRRGRAACYAINLSAQSVGDPGMLRFITAALERSGVDAAHVCFEITETVAITNMARATAFLRGLRALGCTTALDDFGVGYSSFAYLKDLPVDRVKIDGSFVRGLEHDRLKQAMVRAMNEVAHALGKETVAECVETEAALAVLREIGVDYGQGFLLGRPTRAQAQAAGLVVMQGERRGPT